MPIVVVLGGLGLLSLLVPRPPPHARVTVAATVPPQAWLVRRLGRDRVDVEVLLPPGASPHTYDPTPQQVARLASAQLVVEVGHPSFLFERRLLDALTSRQPPPLVVDMMSAVAGANGETDPHVWLSPAVMRATARQVSAALVRLDPGAAPLFRQQLAGVLADIERLDADLHRTLDGLPRRRFLVYHPAWDYLARDYGLEQVAIEAEGKEPSPRQLVALVERARRDGTGIVFVQSGYYDRPARAVAGEIGARVVAVDPMAEDWPANLRRVAALLRGALGGGASGG
ncbi:MAG TPA: zinc ABC transporter substrate-binding protein [Thermoanaerobaculia bacterium]|nr:zinc ABC transporter substrate-binding protein [Thermoanaerobaculia bacterium]